MRSSYSASVAELVRVILLPQRNYPLNSPTVISRALASFLQYVGLIKEEYLDKDDTKEELFRTKFEELLKRYCELTEKPWFGSKVKIPCYSRPEL